MIIDVHGHYTTAPGELQEFRDAQLARLADPETGIAWDDTLQYVNAAGLGGEELAAVLEGNARRVYPALGRRLKARGL